MSTSGCSERREHKDELLLAVACLCVVLRLLSSLRIMWTLLIFIVFTPKTVKPTETRNKCESHAKGNNSFPVVASAAELCWGNWAKEVEKKQKSQKKRGLTLINWSDGNFSAATAWLLRINVKLSACRKFVVRPSHNYTLSAHARVKESRTKLNREKQKWKFQVQKCDVEEKS